MWKVAKDFSVRLGGNTYIDTPNLITYKGASLFRIFRSEEDGMLGIDFDVFDARGNRVATFRKGVVVQGDADQYEIVSGHHEYSVKEKATGRVIACVRRRGVEGAELEVWVHLYTSTGFLLEASPTHTNIGGITISDSTFQGLVTAISIE